MWLTQFLTVNSWSFTLTHIHLFNMPYVTNFSPHFCSVEKKILHIESRLGNLPLSLYLLIRRFNHSIDHWQSRRFSLCQPSLFPKTPRYHSERVIKVVDTNIDNLCSQLSRPLYRGMDRGIIHHQILALHVIFIQYIHHVGKVHQIVLCSRSNSALYHIKAYLNYFPLLRCRNSLWHFQRYVYDSRF